jgi:hypothetical protein
MDCNVVVRDISRAAIDQQRQKSKLRNGQNGSRGTVLGTAVGQYVVAYPHGLSRMDPVTAL